MGRSQRPNRSAKGARGLLAGVFCLVALLPLGADTPVVAPWKFDVVRLKNGRVFRGLVVEETPAGVVFADVRRNPGRPTVVFHTTFAPKEVERIERITPKERAVLSGRLQALDGNGNTEKQRMDELDLEPAAWGKKGKGGLCYKSDHFVLVSNAHEEIVRRAAVRLEQIYAAYTRFLPPQHTGGSPTQILLVGSLAEYQAMLKEQGQNLFNPAYYDVARNRIVCATNVEQLGEDLARVRALHRQRRADLRQREAELNRLYKGNVPAGFAQQLRTARIQMDQADLTNQAVFDRATRRQLQTLYHEAFHAYLANFVYPPDRAEVPRWLNEGLAQIFETAIVEAGELRVGHAEVERLALAKNLLRKGELVGLTDLLRAKPQHFLVAHASDREVSSRHYVTSWALAFYLTFDRRLLGTTKLDEYVQALKRGTPAVEAFHDLVDGQPPAEFEKQFRHFLMHLRTDGTTDARR